MALPYSTRFLGGAISSTQVQSYTVPQNMVAVVKFVYITNGSPGAINCGVVSSAGFWCGAVNGLGAGSPFTWNGMAVLNAGESISSSYSGTNGTIVCSGYLLSTVQ